MNEYHVKKGPDRIGDIVENPHVPRGEFRVYLGIVQQQVARPLTSAEEMLARTYYDDDIPADEAAVDISGGLLEKHRVQGCGCTDIENRGHSLYCPAWHLHPPGER